MVNGSASLTQVTGSIIGARDCSNNKIIWPEIYAKTGAQSQIEIQHPETSSAMTNSLESISQQPNQVEPDLKSSRPPSDTESNPSSGGRR